MKILVFFGFILFFIGMGAGVAYSKEIGISIALLGFYFAGLSISLLMWEMDEYKWQSRLISIIFLISILYHTPNALSSPFLISPWFVYVPCVTMLVLLFIKMVATKSGRLG